MEGLDPYGPLCWRRSSCRPTSEFSHHVTEGGRVPMALEAAREGSVDLCRLRPRRGRLGTDRYGVAGPMPKVPPNHERRGPDRLPRNAGGWVPLIEEVRCQS